MRIIHQTPYFLLEAKTTFHPITGKTLQLVITHPKAQHSKAQRIACLTMPDAAFERLAAVCLHKDEVEP